MMLLPAGSQLAPQIDASHSQVGRYLAAALAERNLGPFSIDGVNWPGSLLVRVQDGSQIVQIAVPRDRLYTSLVFVVLSWMVGTALITLAIAMLFLRNQVRSLRRLAMAAEAFGRGVDVPSFRPQGATEVRQAAAAFLTMRQRIQRQIAQRTEMLAGISHDLRTPLTRMRLELELMGDSEDVRGLTTDVAEMLKMVEAYLGFARGEGDEQAQITDLMRSSSSRTWPRPSGREGRGDRDRRPRHARDRGAPRGAAPVRRQPHRQRPAPWRPCVGDGDRRPHHRHHHRR